MSEFFPRQFTPAEIYDHRHTWAGALRSGLYQQGRNMLSYVPEDGAETLHCCLGVACAINLDNKKLGSSVLSYSDSYSSQYGVFRAYRLLNQDHSDVNAEVDSESLPRILKEYYGLSQASCTVLIGLNDSGIVNFSMIAAVLMNLPIWYPGYDETTGLKL